MQDIQKSSFFLYASNNQIFWKATPFIKVWKITYLRINLGKVLWDFYTEKYRILPRAIKEDLNKQRYCIGMADSVNIGKMPVLLKLIYIGLIQTQFKFQQRLLFLFLEIGKVFLDFRWEFKGPIPPKQISKRKKKRLVHYMFQDLV